MESCIVRKQSSPETVLAVVPGDILIERILACAELEREPDGTVVGGSVPNERIATRVCDLESMNPVPGCPVAFECDGTASEAANSEANQAILARVVSHERVPGPQDPEPMVPVPGRRVTAERVESEPFVCGEPIYSVAESAIAPHGDGVAGDPEPMTCVVGSRVPHHRVPGPHDRKT